MFFRKMILRKNDFVKKLIKNEIRKQLVDGKSGRLKKTFFAKFHPERFAHIFPRERERERERERKREKSCLWESLGRQSNLGLGGCFNLEGRGQKWIEFSPQTNIVSNILFTFLQLDF